MGRRHADAYRKNSKVIIKGFYDIKSSLAKSVSSQYGGVVYNNVDSVMSDPDIDAVSICTPNSQHYKMLEIAIKSEKDILVEKPIVTTEKHCDLLEKITSKSKCIIMVGHTHRFYPCNIALKSVLDSGKIGEPKIINTFDYIPGRNLGQSMPSWIREKKFGGGVLLTDFIHTVDKLPWLVGQPIKKVHTHMLSNFISRGGVDDAVVCTIELKDGLIANCIHGCPSPGTVDMSLKMLGTKGEIHMIFAGELAILTKSKTQIEYPYRGDYIKHSTYAFYSEMGEFVKSVLERREPRVPLKDGIRAVRAVLALEESYKTKRPVLLGN